MDVSLLQCQWTAVFRWIHSFICHYCHASIRESAVCSPTFCQDLSNLIGECKLSFSVLSENPLKCLYPDWLATSDPVSLDVDTGPSDVEGEDDNDSWFRTRPPATDPMDVDPAGPDEANHLGKEERVAEEVQADSAAAQVAATLADLVAYGASSDDGSGEEEEEEEKESTEGSEKKKNVATRKDDEQTGDADNKRDKEEVDQLDGGKVSDAAPKSKGEVFLLSSRAHCSSVSMHRLYPHWMASQSKPAAEAG